MSVNTQETKTIATPQKLKVPFKVYQYLEQLKEMKKNETPLFLENQVPYRVKLILRPEELEKLRAALSLLYKKFEREVKKHAHEELEKIRKDVYEWLQELEEYVNEKVRHFDVEARKYYAELFTSLASKLRKDLGDVGVKIAKIVAADLANKIKEVATKLGSTSAREIVNYLSNIAEKTVEELKKSGAHNIQQYFEAVTKTLINETDNVLRKIEEHVKSKLSELRQKTISYYNELATELEKRLGKYGQQLAEEIYNKILTATTKAAHEIGTQAAEQLAKNLINYANQLVNKLTKEGVTSISQVYEKVSREINKKLQEELNKAKQAYYTLYEQLRKTLVKQLGTEGEKIARKIASELCTKLGNLGQQAVQEIARKVSQVAENLVQKYGKRAINVLGSYVQMLFRQYSASFRKMLMPAVTAELASAPFSGAGTFMGHVVHFWHPGWSGSKYAIQKIYSRYGAEGVEKLMHYIAPALYKALSEAIKYHWTSNMGRLFMTVRDLLVKYLRQEGLRAGIVKPRWHEIWVNIPGIGKVYLHPPEIVGYLYSAAERMGITLDRYLQYWSKNWVFA